MIKSLLIITMAMQGHWFGGQSYDLQVAWSAQAGLADARFHWQLIVADQIIAEQSHTLTNEPLTIRLELPEVRRISTMVLDWSVYPDFQPNREAITSGRVELTVYPRNLLASLPSLLQGRSVGVVGDAKLVAMLDELGIKAQDVPLDMLAFASQSLIIVAADALPGQGDLTDATNKLLSSNRSVLVFAQPHPTRIGPLSTTVQLQPTQWALYPDIPLPSTLLQSGQLIESPQPLKAERPAVVLLQTPGDQSITPLCYVPVLPGTRRVDSAVAQTAVHRSDTARLFWTQQHFEAWQDDPRAQWMLAEAINLLLSDSLETPSFNQYLKTKRDRDPSGKS